MHGYPRYPKKPADAASLSAKAAELRALQSQFLHNHFNRIYTKDAQEVSARLLVVNPEVYTGWNYRKLAFEFNCNAARSKEDSIKLIIDEELKLVENALKQNSKSYGAWYHRKWLLSKNPSIIDFDHELQLFDGLCKKDSHNFHAWNYRRFVTSLMSTSEVNEVEYTEKVIKKDIGIYSAWHHRSVILSRMLETGVNTEEDVLREEFLFVRTALFVSPGDQCGWFYHRCLLHRTIKPEAPLVVFSWPAHGFDLTISADRCMENFSLSPFNCFISEKGTFPLILYFSQAVKGVNSSTVEAKSSFSSNGPLIWKPLTQNNSGTAQAWVTYLSFPDSNTHYSEAYPVDVSVGHSEGIVDSSNLRLVRASEFTFTVRVQPPNPEKADNRGFKKISWKNENCHGRETSFVFPFGQPAIVKEGEATVPAWSVMFIDDEISAFRLLRALPDCDCKIAKLKLARLLMAHDSVMTRNMPIHKAVHKDEVLDLFNDLMKSDPVHTCYYTDERSLMLMQKITSSRESLLKYCHQYVDSTSSNSHNSVCVRFNHLSLSRIGSIGQLLWVQMLDLSHNELRTVEGLEAMQLLRCLNLSNNKICSFTALDPIKHLVTLEVLDISHNEIGAHRIDTTRFLYGSPLSRAIDMIGLDIEEFEIDGGNAMDYLEALLILKNLNLRQLDVAGNAVVDTTFKSFLVKVLRTLRWLDGEEVNE